MTTNELAHHLAELTPRLQVAVLREVLARLGPEERPTLVDGMARALEQAGYTTAAALLRHAHGQPVPSACR